MKKVICIVILGIFGIICEAEQVMINSVSQGIVIKSLTNKVFKVIPAWGLSIDFDQNGLSILQDGPVRPIGFENRVLLAVQETYGEMRTWYDKLIMYSFTDGSVKEFDPRNFGYKFTSVWEAYHVNQDSWAILLSSNMKEKYDWILFDFKENKIVDKNFKARESKSTESTYEKFREFHFNWMKKKIFTDQFADISQSIKNETLQYDYAGNYFVVTDFKKMLLYFAGPHVDEKEQRLVMDLSEFLYIFKFDPIYDQITDYHIFELDFDKLNWHGFLKKVGKRQGELIRINFDQDEIKKYVSKRMIPILSDNLLKLLVRDNSLDEYLNQKLVFTLDYVAFEETVPVEFVEHDKKIMKQVTIKFKLVRTPENYVRQHYFDITVND